MKILKVSLWFIIISLMLWPAVGYSASTDPSPLMLVQEKKKEKAATPSPAPTEEKVASTADMPVYKPPLRGAPGGRVGGGTRGIGDEKPVVLVLAPDHVGLTTQKQPSLYWFISAPTDFPVEVTLIEDKGIKPLLEKRLDPPKQAGIHCIRLADYGISLQQGKTYKWFITVIPDPAKRSKDILSGGGIQVVDPPQGLQAKLDKGGKKRAPYAYAEAGIWYDAVTAASELVNASPKDTSMRKIRASLLEQGGLAQAAEYEKK